MIDGCFQSIPISIDSETGLIAESNATSAARQRRFDADGLLVLPGIVDIHGDAFERQMMPRPRVDFAPDIALADSDRQAIANGITTVFHGLTWSWEPGLRGPENARAMLSAIEGMRPRLAADTRLHLRLETYNLDAEAEIVDWLRAGRVDLLAFNDHVALADEASQRPHKLAPMVERSGLDRDAFLALVAQVKSRADEVPDSIRRLAEVAAANGIPLLSHDDSSPEQRRWFRALGCRIAEFPTSVETAREAAAAGEAIVLGAPNVVRGGSHTGWIDASKMIAQGLCSILASDYYYPAPLLAAFRLAVDRVLPLERAWTLVSQRPAAAAGLADRGTIAPGQRADLIMVDADEMRRPRVIAVMVKGRLVYLNDAGRIA
ncbi:MAG: alpha-D-ribose 1-methylphosphonate 5-triphosphate diphosphatase [Xanthobacteraceae bacterium]|nr:alpha-D-ribose 1-methylphosphonate 5-triphosphate diphosphatase [Xanthobacteraceae bacterium]